MNTNQTLIFKAANDAVVASYEAHGDYVPAQDAYDFIKEALSDEYDSLPDRMPSDFLISYRQLVREQRMHNRFVLAGR